MYETILVPTDGSHVANAAIDHALELGSRFGATVHALSVVDTERAYGAGFGEEFGVNAQHVIDQLEQRAEDAVREVVAAADARDIEAVSVVREGTPHRTIRSYARDEGVDCIVMGTHGRTGIGRVLLGSTTERVLRHADVPVLVVRSTTTVE